MDNNDFVCRRLEEAPKHYWPFPFFFATQVFPPDLHSEIMQYLEEKDDFELRAFANRKFARDSEPAFLDFMKSPEFFRRMLSIFELEFKQRFAGTRTKMGRELRFIRDQKAYKIGPHTDIGDKVLSLLFYLPKTDEHCEYGTSVYQPKDINFTCSGGPHYPFEGFEEVWRAPYLPNSCFGFWRTDNSFHGVPPLPVEIRRDVLLYNIYTQPNSTKP